MTDPIKERQKVLSRDIEAMKLAGILPKDYEASAPTPARDNLTCAACVCASILGLLMGVAIGFIVGAGTCF